MRKAESVCVGGVAACLCVRVIAHRERVIGIHRPAQVPSRDDLAYLNVHAVEDSVKYGHLRLRNIPVTHNKSPTRWRDVRTIACRLHPK